MANNKSGNGNSNNILNSLNSLNNTSNRANSNSLKANSNSQKANSNSLKANSNSLKANSNSLKANSNGQKANSNGQKANSNGQKANSNGLKANNSSNNTVMNKLKKKGGSQTIVIICSILLIIILVVAGYFLYKFVKGKKRSVETTKQFIPYIHDATVDKTLNYGSIPESSQGNEYNINFWIYINDYTYRKDEDKCILYKGEKIGTLNNANIENNVNTKCNPGVWLLKNVNTLRVVIGLDTKYGRQNCSQTNPVCNDSVIDTEVCEIPHFPVQKWVDVNISLRNNVLDIFMNGTLKKSCILSGFPTITKGDMFVCHDGGFNGYISNMKYSNKTLAVSKIEQMYKNGPTLSN